jgi:hypothetical protein
VETFLSSLVNWEFAQANFAWFVRRIETVWSRLCFNGISNKGRKNQRFTAFFHIIVA